MGIINLCPEAVELVNQLCEPGNLEDTIITLEAAEDSLQKQAYDYDSEAISLYTVAYQLKLFKKDLIRLKTLLENGREDEKQD
ncbi:MAG: hypothetical protein IJ868_00560 [Prevotella sp.]|nr:hypothetical protein [Prevotella sp.]